MPAERMHLRLSLRWSLDAAQEERLCQSMERVHVPRFFLPLTGIHVTGKAPFIYVSVGVGKGHPYFFTLHRYVQDAAIRAQVEPDLKPFHPHIAIASARQAPQGKFLRFLRENAEAEWDLLTVDGFALFSTKESGEEGALTVERRWKLEPE